MDEMSAFAKTIMEQKYSHVKSNGKKETWPEIARRVTDAVLDVIPVKDFDKEAVYSLIEQRKFIPGGRYLYAAGRPFHQTQNCLLLRAEDSREGWAAILHKAGMALMTGAGIGIDYSAVRAKGSKISRTGGQSTGPLALMQMVNECGRHIMQGGARRSAIWAGLNWKHKDVMEFITIKNWPDAVKKLKDKDFNFPATLDMTNISVILDADFFKAYNNGDTRAHEVYQTLIRQMLSTAEPGISVDFDNPRESLRNACTEVTSEDDSDICNLGSLNLARIETIDEFKDAVKLATIFLLAGTIYSHVPYEKVDEVRQKNRRLGLGLMGIHEWLLKRGKKYDPDSELGSWLQEYAKSTEYAHEAATEWGITKPVKTRAIAPTGTIGIVAETTTGIEPIFCVAFRRRYLDGTDWKYQYVVDPTAKRLIESGVAVELIEDAYTLAENPERRVRFQHWVQQYVDHAISSTINLPEWNSPQNNESTVKSFGDMLIYYLPKLRGITAYPDGCRGGQPLTRVKYETAIQHVGQVFVEAQDICDITKTGSC